MKKLLSSLLALTLVLALAFAFTGCGSSGGDDAASEIEIAVPNDTTNEARALLLLQDNGLITLKDGAGITATVQDITDNPHNIKFQEVEAAQLEWNNRICRSARWIPSAARQPLIVSKPSPLPAVLKFQAQKHS